MQHIDPNSFNLGYAAGALSIGILFLVFYVFYARPVRKNMRNDNPDKFRFPRRKFNYMDKVGQPIQYSDHMK